MKEILSKIIPIIALIVLGYMIKRKQYLDKSVFRGFKKIVFDLALPSSIFLSFVNVEMKYEYIVLNIWIILILVIMIGIGKLINRIKHTSSNVLPYIISGTAFGLLGVPLYSTAFGVENVANYAIMAIGHEVFIWLICVPLIRSEFAGEKLTYKGIVNIITSPLILAVVLGSFFSISGLSGCFSTNPFFIGIYETLNYLAKLGTPMILMIVGYDLEFDRAGMKVSVIYTVIRRISFMGFGLLIAYLILPYFMELTIYYKYALITFLMLPPPYSFPTIFEMVGASKEQVIISNNVVVVDTLLCIISFIVLVFVTG